MAIAQKIMAPFRIIHSVCSGLKGYIHKRFDAVGYAKSLGVRLGKGCRLYGVNFGSEPYLVTLGNHVSATKTTFVTHDGGVWVFRDKEPDIDVVAPITVGNNVFFGYGAIVMPGITIGNNVVVGAGAIVTKDIASNCVAVGIPARPLKSLEEYRKAVDSKVVNIKKLSFNEKKRFLLKQFGLG